MSDSAPLTFGVDGGSVRIGAVHRLRLTVEILMTYLRVRMLMRRRPVADVVESLRCAGAVARRGADPFVTGVRVGNGVTRVLRALPTDGRCLMQSLVLVGLLARRGLACTLIIGVSAEPSFAAHAWVEVHGRPVLPSGDGVSAFAPLATFAAP